MGLLSHLQNVLRDSQQDASPDSRDSALQLASAVLLLEMERADYQHDALERDTIQALLQDQFRLTTEEARLLLQEASEESEQAVSLHDYVSALNDYLTAADKLHIVRMLWQVAFADGHLHHYEEHLLRQLADLLHIPHHDYVRVKLQVSGEL